MGRCLLIASTGAPTPAFEAYEVPGVTLIPQDMQMACWYASAMMLLNWRERFRPGPMPISQGIDALTLKLYKANDGIRNDQILPLAKRLGLVSVPPMSPTTEALKDWMRKFGPLWTNGKQHIVVIAGIRQATSGSYEVKVYDPWPSTGITWRTLSGWYTGFNPGAHGVSSRDTDDAVEAVFLHAP